MMKNHKGDQGHSLSGPGKSTGELCPVCNRRGYHSVTCPRYPEKSEAAPASTDLGWDEEPGVLLRLAFPDQAPPKEADTKVVDSKKLVVWFIEHKTKQRIMELHLDYEMTGILPARGDFISPFGLKDPRTYKVLMHHAIMDTQPETHIYLEKI